jgi:hypothetical protein
MLMKRISSERGSVMVVAIMVITVMVGVGLATLSRVDNQSKQSRVERERESSFNLGEAALTSQVYILGRKGTGTAASPYPLVCPTAGNAFCPETASVAANYDAASQPDFGPSSTSWRTWVRDNASSATATPDTFWDDSLLTSRPRYDQNGDTLMWVRAEASVRGRKRAIVGLIRLETRAVTFPAYAVLAGKFQTTNSGTHSAQIVDTTGSLGVAVRCTGAVPSSTCINYQPNKGQIQPNNVTTGYSTRQAISTADRDALLEVARANGTYYSSCPTNLSGKVVAIDAGNAALCDYQGNDIYNSASNPGILMIVRGRLELGGGSKYYGLVYHLNLNNSTAWDLVTVEGNAQVIGGVLVDGDGGVSAGSSGQLNIVFSANSFNGINLLGTAGVVQNTWREIQPLPL